jgi:hypothetical protein
VYPKSGNYDILLQSVDKLLKKKPYLGTFLDHYEKALPDQQVFS